jgi:hypothetical protein
VGVVVVVRGGADKRKQGHCDSKMANRPSAPKVVSREWRFPPRRASK